MAILELAEKAEQAEALRQFFSGDCCGGENHFADLSRVLFEKDRPEETKPLVHSR